MSLTRLLAELPEPLFSTYKIERVLGVGAYAVVYQVRSVHTQEAFALKVIEKEPMRVRMMTVQLEREVALLEAHSHYAHVVNLLEALQTSTHVFLRFELCSETLEEIVARSGPMTEDEAFSWLRQACLGVQALHANGIIHRDLKPSNLLVDSNGVLHICDFGWACSEEDRLIGACGTPEYSPPECSVNGRGRHTTKVDVYGLGACLQHMLLGRVPKAVRDLPKGLSEETIDFVQDLMQADPKDRPTIEEALWHSKIAGDSPVVSNIWRAISEFTDFIQVPASSPSHKYKSQGEDICGFRPFY
jgi:serine/threonine protein kinase